MTSRPSLSICMISDDFLPAATGVGTHLQALCPVLVELGHRISVVTTRRRGEPEHEQWRGVEVYRVTSLKVFGFHQALPSGSTLSSLLDRLRPDIVHLHYLGYMCLLAVRACVRRRLPRVYTYHMTEDHLTQPRVLRPLRRFIAGRIVALCNAMDLVISVSQRLALQLPGKGIRVPVLTISNPVRFPTIESDPAVTGADGRGPFTVMFAGRLDPEKNLPLLISAFAQLVSQVPGSILWIAGSGGQRAALQRLCDDLGVAASVQFLGHLDEAQLSRRYADCDVFVLPSLVETQGLVAMEAMWFGKPIIVADSVVSATELVREGENGFIVDSRQDAPLVQRLRELSADPERRRAMGRSGQIQARQYQPETVAKALSEAYASTLHRVGR